MSSVAFNLAIHTFARVVCPWFARRGTPALLDLSKTAKGAIQAARASAKPHRDMNAIPNVLAGRYASDAMKSIWSAEGRIVLEREFWIAVMKAQKDLGLDIPQEAIDAYERVKDNVNVDSINARERITRHDVKARIEEFFDLAGCQHIHKGMTSRDLTENV